METITPSFTFTDNSLSNFDKKLENKLGFTFEGSLFGEIWVYRRNNQKIDIQVGFGGVRFVTIYTSENGRPVDTIKLDMTTITSPTKLFNKLQKILA